MCKEEKAKANELKPGVYLPVQMVIVKKEQPSTEQVVHVTVMKEQPRQQVIHVTVMKEQPPAEQEQEGTT